MSGNNIARKIQRWRLRNGKMTPAAYKALRRKVDIDEADDAINAPRRRWAWMVRRELAGEIGTTLEIRLLNMLQNLRLVEVTYHPTKGFRYRRGEQVERENLAA